MLVFVLEGGEWDREKCALLDVFVLDMRRGAEYKKRALLDVFLLLNVRDGVRKELGTKNMPLRACFLCSM